MTLKKGRSIADAAGNHETLTVPTVRHHPSASLRRRMLAGLLFVLPFVVTAWIVYWLYSFLENLVIGPAARLVVQLIERRADVGLPFWFVNYVAPLIGVVAVLVLLYVLGFFARVRADRILDAILLRVPIITSIHKAVSQAFATFRGSNELSRFRRAVLVAFPHPGMRVPGFVTASCRDKLTQKTILCVYVPTTPIPTSGYVLLVPEEEVTELNWDLEQTLQAVVSFGITAPAEVSYQRSAAPDEGTRSLPTDQGPVAPEGTDAS